MSKFLNSINIEKLKNIKKLVMDFDVNKRVCAIFGENGCGKSTILYALACIYQKDKLPNNTMIGESYKFSQFFLPTNYEVWGGSELSIKYSEYDKDGVALSFKKPRMYKKKKERWTKYEDRPRREIYFCGIELCIPPIERETRNSKLTLTLDSNAKKIKDKILRDFSFVMNRQYEEISHFVDEKYKLVKTQSMEYPSLFMGAGENKIIEILSILHKAQKGALILIDEIDLTLHTFSLKKLLKLIIQIADEKELQVIFTSHREEIVRFNYNIDIKYITNNLNPDKTECLTDINSDCLVELTGNVEIKRVIYVEDRVSKEIVNRFLVENQMYEGSEIKIFGAADNVFTIACGLYLIDKNLFDKSIFVLDGDRYITTDEKEEQIKKKLTGNEPCRESQREEILRKIIQYQSNGTNPERFIFDTICNSNSNTEIRRILSRTRAVRDEHDLIPNDLLQTAVEEFSKNSIWNDFTYELKSNL